MRVFDKEVFDRTSEFRIVAAYFVEKGAALLGPDCQRGIEQVLDQLLLISHNPLQERSE
jgi:hypothetical protein